MFLTRLTSVWAHWRVILRILYLPLPPPCLCTVSLKNVYNMIVPCIHRGSHSCILNVNTFLLINSSEKRHVFVMVLFRRGNILVQEWCVRTAKQTAGPERVYRKKQVQHKLIQAVFLIISKWHLFLGFFKFRYKSISDVVVWIKVIG